MQSARDGQPRFCADVHAGRAGLHRSDETPPRTFQSRLPKECGFGVTHHPHANSSPVANLWMIEHSNREAREISERAGDIYNTVCLLGERLLSLGASISTTANKYNDAVKAVQGKQGLLGKVSRFQSLSQRANKSFPRCASPIEPDVEAIRLEDQTESQPPRQPQGARRALVVSTSPRIEDCSHQSLTH